MSKKPVQHSTSAGPEYTSILGEISDVIEEVRRSAVRAVNAAMTAAYWLIGGHIVESEQAGNLRADYGTGLLKRLAADLTSRFGRGFSVDNLESMRAFYLAYPPNRISETSSRMLPEGSLKARISETPSRISSPAEIARAFPLSWSHYVLLVRRSRSDEARAFYETEALRGGWSVRQLARQMSSQFYERTALSRNKAVMLRKGQKALPEDAVTPREAIKDPYVLEFLDLKDEYSAAITSFGRPSRA